MTVEGRRNLAEVLVLVVELSNNLLLVEPMLIL